MSSDDRRDDETGGEREAILRRWGRRGSSARSSPGGRVGSRPPAEPSASPAEGRPSDSAPGRRAPRGRDDGADRWPDDEEFEISLEDDEPLSPAAPAELAGVPMDRQAVAPGPTGRARSGAETIEAVRESVEIGPIVEELGLESVDDPPAGAPQTLALALPGGDTLRLQVEPLADEPSAPTLRFSLRAAPANDPLLLGGLAKLARELSSSDPRLTRPAGRWQPPAIEPTVAGEPLGADDELELEEPDHEPASLSGGASSNTPNDASVELELEEPDAPRSSGRQSEPRALPLSDAADEGAGGGPMPARPAQPMNRAAGMEPEAEATGADDDDDELLRSPSTLSLELPRQLRVTYSGPSVQRGGDSEPRGARRSRVKRGGAAASGVTGPMDPLGKKPPARSPKPTRDSSPRRPSGGSIALPRKPAVDKVARRAAAKAETADDIEPLAEETRQPSRSEADVHGKPTAGAVPVVSGHVASRPVAKQRTEQIVGIDFGTSYSCVGVLGDGLQLLADDTGEQQLPSLVSFPRPGEVVIGTEARRRLAREARWTITSPKRLVGRPFNDPQVQPLLQALALRSFAGTDRLIRFQVHDQIYAITDICTPILKELRSRASARLGTKVSKVVLAVPVAFGSLQRSAIELAARQAGLDVVGMITEPSAALLARGFRGKRGLAAVYDLGGGTFDFCVVEINDATFRVRCAGGDPWLGGDDFDTALATLVADRFWKESGVDLRTRTVEWQRLVLACEQAKRELSQHETTNLRVENLLYTAKGEQGLDYELTREAFVHAVAPLIGRSIELARGVMKQAGIGPEEIGAVVMTGGSARIPAVHQAVRDFFGREPLCDDPDLAVVRGTSLRAAELAGVAMSATTTGGRTLREVAGRKVIAVSEGANPVALFKRDTPLPAEAQCSFQSVRDGQREMTVVLLESDGLPKSKRRVIGQLRYRGLHPRPAGQSSVDFGFLLDEDGILHVTAEVEGELHERSIRLD